MERGAIQANKEPASFEIHQASTFYPIAISLYISTHFSNCSAGTGEREPPRDGRARPTIRAATRRIDTGEHHLEQSSTTSRTRRPGQTRALPAGNKGSEAGTHPLSRKIQRNLNIRNTTSSTAKPPEVTYLTHISSYTQRELSPFPHPRLRRPAIHPGFIGPAISSRANTLTQ